MRLLSNGCCRMNGRRISQYLFGAALVLFAIVWRWGRNDEIEAVSTPGLTLVGVQQNRQENHISSAQLSGHEIQVAEVAPRRSVSVARSPSTPCFTKLTQCARSWASQVQPPANELVPSISYKSKNDCGFGERDLKDLAQSIFKSHVFRFHGDSTLREILKTLIKFIGVSGNLEKRDANKNERGPRYFDEQAADIGGPVRIMFRFDHFPENLQEPVLGEPASFRDAPRIDIISMGVHLADYELVDKKSDYDDARHRMHPRVEKHFGDYLAAVQADPTVKQVYILLQELECEQMGRAVNQPRFRKFKSRAPYCGNISRLTDEFSHSVERLLERLSGVSSKVVVVGPLNCRALKPKGSNCIGGGGACACSRDGIHLRGRFLKLRTDALINLVSQAASCEAPR